jgi:hypothetical protein
MSRHASSCLRVLRVMPIIVPPHVLVGASAGSKRGSGIMRSLPASCGA